MVWSRNNWLYYNLLCYYVSICIYSQSNRKLDITNIIYYTFIWLHFNFDVDVINIKSKHITDKYETISIFYSVIIFIVRLRYLVYIIDYTYVKLLRNCINFCANRVHRWKHCMYSVCN